MSTTSDGPRLGQEQAVVRKVMHRLAQLDGTDTDDMDLITAANTALENVEDLHERVETLEAKVDVLEDRAPRPDEKAYDEMDRPDKATVVQSKLRNEADATNGRAAMKYKGVIRVFDGHPSPGHAYDIMETAATGEGFALGTNKDGEKRLTYNASRVNDSA